MTFGMHQLDKICYQEPRLFLMIGTILFWSKSRGHPVRQTSHHDQANIFVGPHRI